MAGELLDKEIDHKGGKPSDDKTVTATYGKDSKNYHRFFVDGGQGIAGTIYIPRGDIPNRITISLKWTQKEIEAGAAKRKKRNPIMIGEKEQREAKEALLKGPLACLNIF